MKKNFETVKKCPLFSDIHSEDLQGMLSCLGARVISANKKTTVFFEGDNAEYVGIVLSGKIQLTRTDYNGNRTIVSIIETAGLFGESFACAGTSLPVDVIAAEDSEIMLIQCKRIITPCCNACGFHNKLIFNLLHIVAAKNLAFTQKIEITSQRTTREKLLTFLQIYSKKSGSNSFVIPYDRQELADYLEVDRSGLSSEISKLRNEGIIECRKNKFRLL